MRILLTDTIDIDPRWLRDHPAIYAVLIVRDALALAGCLACISALVVLVGVALGGANV